MYNFSSSLHKYLKKIKVKDINKEKFTIVEVWEDLVGEFFAKNSKAVYIKDYVLHVKVSHSCFLSEMKFLKDDIINKYNDKFEREVLKDINFRIDEREIITKKEDKSILPNQNLTKKEDKKYFLNKNLTDYDKKLIDDNLSKIKDSNLKDVMASFLKKTRERELSLIDQGWKKCPKCLALHNQKEIICKMCKLKDS